MTVGRPPAGADGAVMLSSAGGDSGASDDADDGAEARRAMMKARILKQARGATARGRAERRGATRRVRVPAALEALPPAVGGGGGGEGGRR